MQAQDSVVPETSAGVANYFSGRWRCAGQFTNGKHIESDLWFTRVLGGKWLRYTHMDRPPNCFQAQAMWGVDTSSGELISIMQDNFGAVRLFRSAGWRDSSSIFESAPLLTKRVRHERFTYRVEGPSRFRMEYRVGHDGAQWRLGAYLERNKQS